MDDVSHAPVAPPPRHYTDTDGDQKLAVRGETNRDVDEISGIVHVRTRTPFLKFRVTAHVLLSRGKTRLRAKCSRWCTFWLVRKGDFRQAWWYAVSRKFNGNKGSYRPSYQQ